MVQFEGLKEAGIRTQKLEVGGGREEDGREKSESGNRERESRN